MGRKKLNWRRLQDLNLHYQSQNLMCCPYTKALCCEADNPTSLLKKGNNAETLKSAPQKRKYI